MERAERKQRPFAYSAIGVNASLQMAATHANGASVLVNMKEAVYSKPAILGVGRVRR